MEIRKLHGWRVAFQEAVAIQRRLKNSLILSDVSLFGEIRTVGGADISYDHGSGRFFAAAVVLSFPDLHILEQSSASARVLFPYIPGLLSFREGPPLIAAFARLKCRPDIVLFDGQGIAHPRGIGLASHMGLWLDIPSIGCAKKRLTGDYIEPGLRAGQWSPLHVEEQIVGAVVRTKLHVKPVFVSQGHRVSLERAIRIVLACTAGYRLPEPVRLAHLAVNQLRLLHRKSSGRK